LTSRGLDKYSIQRMGKSRPQNPSELLDWMLALGDSARLRLLRLLERNELGVAELSDVLQLPQSTISRHLKILADGGWIRWRRVGTSHLSTMRHDGLSETQRRLWQLARQQTEGWPGARQDDIRLQRRLRDRQDSSRRFFTGAAAEWDELRSRLYGHDFTIEAMLSLLSPGLVVADLGCGTGQIIERLAGHVKRVIGVDNTPAMYEAARRRLQPVPNVDIRVGDLASLPIDSGGVDAALMVLALSYVTDPLQCLREMARILRPGGRAIVVDVTQHDREDFRVSMGQSRLGFESGEMTDLLAQAGLGEPRVRDLPPAPGVKGPALFVASAAKA
jgi:ArsR family transcriptional regulator